MAVVNPADVNSGPIDDSLLYLQSSHVCTSVWQDRNEHSVRVRNSKLLDDIDPHVLQYVHLAGFYGLFQLGFRRIDNLLITALVERWRPETHTFHFLPGECTITLKDIKVLGGISVDGPPIIRSEAGETKAIRLARIVNLLGRTPEPSDLSDQYSGVNGTWLAAHFNESHEDADDATVRCFARATIIRILGSQYFSDTSGSYISLVCLPFLEDLEVCSGYSWGSAILSVLYRNLCKTYLRKVPDFARAAILLQMWAWTRLTQIRPIPEVPAELVVPQDAFRYTFGHRWTRIMGRRAPDVVQHNLRHYRGHFDQMLPHQIEWEPYLPYMDILPDYSMGGSNIWRARVPLIYFDIVELHQPDRVMRQFGMIQRIPPAPMRDDRTHQMSRKGRAYHDWLDTHARSLGIWNDRYNHIVHGDLHDGQVTVSYDYMPWYLRVTRRIIWPPEFVAPPRGFRANAGRIEKMKDIISYAYRRFRDMQSERDMKVMEDELADLRLDPAEAYRRQFQPETQG